jgi:choline kinase
VVPNSYLEEEAERERETERRVEELVKEARLWRVANSAQWVAWGIVQAKVPELDGLFDPSPSSSSPDTVTSPTVASPKPELNSDRLSPEVQEKRYNHDHDKRPEGFVAEALLNVEGGSGVEANSGEVNEVVVEAQAEEGEEEFDYLGYAQERAWFFWGDVVSLGLVTKEELPVGLRERLKVLDY